MGERIRRLLDAEDASFDERWESLQSWLRDRFGREVGLEGILFLIGVQSRGRGYQPELEKEEKQDVIMEGTYCAFETIGLYERVGLDENGFWIWERSVDRFPQLSVDNQEKLLKHGILNYFTAYLET